jgi:hypothetical protein
MNELQDFERELRTALVDSERTADPPDGLTERLIANTAQRPTSGHPHRARLGRIRWLPPALAAAAVISTVAVAALVTTVVASDHHIAPLTHLPTVHPTPTPTRTPTSTPTPTPTQQTPTNSSSTAPTSSSSPTTRSSTTPASPPTLSGRWTDSRLTITDHSLGAVSRGMSLTQAKAAAGTALSSPGDGIFQPTDAALTGSTRLQFSWAVTCFDASRSGSGNGTSVSTSAGVRLGDQMSRVRTVYGPQATPFTADPNWTGPGNIPTGVIVHFNDGVLLFVGSSADRRGGTIASIRGASDARTASSTFC